MDTIKTSQIWSRLIEGKTLEGLGLGIHDGRADLRGLAVPSTVEIKRFDIPNGSVSQLHGQINLKGVHWTGLDFTGSTLEHLRFIDAEISDCVFSKCRCVDWRMWSTSVSDARFHGADLRSSALGGILEDRRNLFRRVDFTRADMRQSVHFAAEFIGCIFKETRLDEVDFQGTVFRDCRFEGELREVLFHRKAFRGDAMPPNEMAGVDFSRAQLRYVEFRGLDLADVRFPSDNDHFILDPYREKLDRFLSILKDRSDVASKKLTAVLKVEHKWLGANQRRGVLNRNDLAEIVGEDRVGEFLLLLGLA